MKELFSLRWKILAWFCLNLALAGGALFLLLREQFRAGSRLSAPISARLEAIAHPLTADLRKTPESNWSEAFERAAVAWRGYGVQAAIYRNDATLLAGNIPVLPVEVSRIIDQYDTRKRGDPSARKVPAHPVGDTGLEKFMLVAGTPPLYWAGVHLDSAPGDRPLPVTLLFASDSLRGGGLFLDYTPWVWIGGGMVFASVLLWLPFVHRLVQALRQIANDAEQIAEGRSVSPRELTQRDEIGRLSRAQDHMAARIDGLIAGQRRFLGDTAHELLSPLARLEVVLSIFEHNAGPEESGMAEGALAEVRQMAELINELLSYSKAGVGGKNIALQPLALAEIATQVVAREPRCAGLVAVDVPGSLRVLAEPDLFARALSNVLRNALRYASPIAAGGEGTYSFRPLRGSDGRAAGPITISAEKQGEHVLLRVADQGPGVPDEALKQLFDPFFRPDTARTREAGGTGLGLAIVKSCLEACGGSVTARNREPHGLQVEFTLLRAD